MIDVVHTKQGKSFQGLVAYLLEGSKGQENPERVGWTETRNLATDRPQSAARVMAATALDQARLKEEAGISNTGRKSKNHVLHYTLSWAEDQDPSREEMMRAVDGSLAVLGEKAGKKGGRNGKAGREAVRDQFASEHQVLVVSHADTAHPHVHVVVNRVHPEHGVMLPTSNDFKRLSRWAEKYERETGGILIDQRAINNAARDREESVPGQKRVPRDVYELEGASNDNRPATQRVRDEQRAKDAKLARESAEQRAAQKQEWTQLSADHRARVQDHRTSSKDEIRRAMRHARDSFKDDWATLYHEHRAATQAFERREDNLAGKAINALKAALSLRAPVNVLWSKGARKAQLERAQEQQKAELAARQRGAVEQARKDELARVSAARERLTHLYNRKRAELILRQRVAKAELQQKWKAREAERKAAWERHHKQMAALPEARQHGEQTVDPNERIARALRIADQARKSAKDSEQNRDLEDDRDR